MMVGKELKVKKESCSDNEKELEVMMKKRVGAIKKVVSVEMVEKNCEKGEYFKCIYIVRCCYVRST